MARRLGGSEAGKPGDNSEESRLGTGLWGLGSGGSVMGTLEAGRPESLESRKLGDILALPP